MFQCLKRNLKYNLMFQQLNKKESGCQSNKTIFFFTCQVCVTTMSFLRHASVNKLSLTFKIDFAISNCFCVDFRESLKPNQSFELRLLGQISCFLVCHPVQGVPASFGLILSKKVEFSKCFEFHALLEIQDANEYVIGLKIKSYYVNLPF